ncbi:MAG: hypothetical protein AB1938_32660 [Myxococcota bacterium]
MVKVEGGAVDDFRRGRGKVAWNVTGDESTSRGAQTESPLVAGVAEGAGRIVTSFRKIAGAVAGRSMCSMSGRVAQVLERLLDVSTVVSSTELARAAGVSRQAAHKLLAKQVQEGSLVVRGKARAARYSRITALRTRLEVASAGSTFRLSARLLLDGVTAGEVTLDFTGVVDVSEEFLEEIFLVWAPANPAVTLKVAHLPARFAPLLFGLARRKGMLAPKSWTEARAEEARRAVAASRYAAGAS